MVKEKKKKQPKSGQMEVFKACDHQPPLEK
jgi:hypothetical protein